MANLKTNHVANDVPRIDSADTDDCARLAQEIIELYYKDIRMQLEKRENEKVLNEMKNRNSNLISAFKDKTHNFFNEFKDTLDTTPRIVFNEENIVCIIRPNARKIVCFKSAIHHQTERT